MVCVPASGVRRLGWRSWESRVHAEEGVRSVLAVWHHLRLCGDSAHADTARQVLSLTLVGLMVFSSLRGFLQQADRSPTPRATRARPRWRET